MTIAFYRQPTCGKWPTFSLGAVSLDSSLAVCKHVYFVGRVSLLSNQV